MDFRLQSLSRLAGLVFFLAATTAGAAQLRVTIEGLDGELREAARASLTLQEYADRDPSPAQVRRLFDEGRDEIGKALEPFGYYNARVDGELKPIEEGYEAIYRVTPGDPMIVRERNVRVLGEAAKMPRVERALRRFAPAEGEPLDHAVYERSKAGIEERLFDAGFLRAKATRHRVEVSRKANTADIDLAWQSGPRMHFGDVQFSETQFPEEFLQRYVPWKPGDYYSPVEVLEFQQRLIDADYFSTVFVEPDISDASSIEVPIRVTLTPAKRTVYTASAYISTNTGPGVRVAMDRRWVNRRGHKLGASIENAQRLKALDLRYGIPMPGPNNRSLNFGTTYREEQTETSDSRMQRATANETIEWRGFTRTLGLQYLSGNFEVAEEQRFSSLFYAEGTLSRRQANDFFFPRRGYSFTLGARFAPQGPLTDTSFSQVTLDAKGVRSVGRRQRVLLRGSLGAMAVDDFDQLPPELRFFAGGDRSIRGYDYQELGTTNAAGKVIGGTYLAVASVEYERYFLEKWGAAVFVDAGDAFRAAEFDINIGAGVGVRWRSPIGIVRVDFAKPISSELADAIRFHVTIGPDL